MKLYQTFTVDTLPSAEEYEPVPAGWYTCVIREASVENTRAGTGSYIKVQYHITGPTHQGRVVFGNLNIRNPNPKAEEIGHKQLNSLLRSIGIASIDDTDQLIGGNCQIKVAVSKSEQYGEGNEVKGWKAIQGSAPPPPMNAPAFPAPSGAGSEPAQVPAKKPWER